MWDGRKDKFGHVLVDSNHLVPTIDAKFGVGR
jgi:hypothetical protein